MKIRPVILCGGAGTRLWPDFKKHQVKQFIDFGGWNLFGKALERINNSSFDEPIISTNSKYLREVKQNLKKNKINKYKIILEPVKKNTGPAILVSALIKDIPNNQPLIFFTADHLIEKSGTFNRELKKNTKHLNKENIFIFGIKPSLPSNQFGYFITKKNKAKQLIKKGGYWNSGIFFARKDSIINNFRKYQKIIYRNSLKAVSKSKFKDNTYYLDKSSFNHNPSKSFDYSILEKTKNINAIKLNILWSDLGSWKEILLMFNKNKSKYYKKKNIFYKPWGSYVNLFKGKNFLIKELKIKPKGVLSLQKHFHRSEHWVVTKGVPKVTLNKKFFFVKSKETVYIPKGSIHRVQNPNNKTVTIMEVQLGSILKETDIVRFKDIYGRSN